MNLDNCSSRGYTLTEVMIAFAIVAMILVTAYFVFYQQIFKAKDGRRKADLHGLTNILEDFFNNEGCYPRPTEICYDAEDDNDIPCYICGSEEDSPDIGYDLPCNPDHPEKKYLYEVPSGSCPQWYRIYTEMSDPDNVGFCKYGLCGPDPYGFDYGVSSPNIGLELSSEIYGYEASTNACNDCGSMTQCERGLNRGDYSQLYSSNYECCLDNQSALNCNFYALDIDTSECVYCGSYQQCRDAGFDKSYGSFGACCDDNPTATNCAN